MTARTAAGVDGDVAAAIRETVRDYYEGWFDGDAGRMQRALHPDLVKRGFGADGRTIDSDTAATMVDATGWGGSSPSRSPSLMLRRADRAMCSEG